MRQPSYESSSFNALYWLLGTLTVIFFVELTLQRVFQFDPMTVFGSLSYTGIRLGMVWQFLSYGLVHGSFFHFFFNALVLFGIGRMVQQTIGPKNFLIAFFVSVLLGGLCWLGITTLMTGGQIFPLYSRGLPRLVGASGGIMGILAVLAYLVPNQRMQVLLFFILPLNVTPKIILICLLVFDSLGLIFNELNLFGQGSIGIAHSAHLGGVLGGFLFCRIVLARGNKPASSKSEPKSDILPPSWTKKPSAQTGKFSINFTNRAQLRKEVDRILDKINTQGFGSLSEEERKILDKAKDLLSR